MSPQSALLDTIILKGCSIRFGTLGRRRKESLAKVILKSNGASPDSNEMIRWRHLHFCDLALNLKAAAVLVRLGALLEITIIHSLKLCACANT